MTDPLVSVILPTYAEADNIGPLLTDLRTELSRGQENWEIVVVDDLSPDGTYERAAEIAGTDPRILVHRRDGRGLAGAIRYGIERSRGTSVVVMDSDYNHDPARVLELVRLLDFYDLVIGSRFVMGGGMSNRTRYYLSFVYNLFVRTTLRTQVQDNLSGFFAIRRELLDMIPADRVFRGYGDYFIRLLLHAYRADWRLLEVPVVYRERPAGQSKSRLFRMMAGYTRTVLELRIRGTITPRRETKAATAARTESR
jgi:dolichol-phosphate mannosyltransferase